MGDGANDVEQVKARLREQGIDIVRLGFCDMIGVDRGRDVPIDELGTAAGHGLAFCRATFHTTPMGDVVPVQGGIEDGLPDVLVRPDFSTLAPLPWEPGALSCIGDVFNVDGEPAPEHLERGPPGVDLLADLGLQAVVGPELEYFDLESGRPHPTPYPTGPERLRVAAGDPAALLKTLRQLRDADLQVTAANRTSSVQDSSRSISITLNWSMRPTAPFA